ncbi:MAG: hypothetical protein Q9218_002706 [Villophora microphyllina]
MRIKGSLGVIASFWLVAVVLAKVYPVVREGNYIITGCGDHGENAVAVLQQLKAVLDAVLQKSTLRTVYDKFFHGVNPNVVTSLLSNIAIGADIPTDGQPFQPTIVCANPDMPEVAQPWKVCQDPNVIASAHPNNRYVFLCPRFWDMRTVPDARDCVGTLPNGHISVGQMLARTQLTILLHELVDIYLALSPGHAPLKPQVFGLHAVLDLPPDKSSINPANYAFYVATQCTKYEPPESTRPHERILAFDEDASNTTNCADDPLAAFGGCPGVTATDTFTTVTMLPTGSAGSSAAPSAAPPTA